MPEIVRNVVKFTKIFEKYVTKNLSQNGSRFATPEVVLKKPAKLLLPVRQPSHRRAFSDSDHAECRGVYGLRLRSSVEDFNNRIITSPFLYLYSTMAAQGEK